MLLRQVLTSTVNGVLDTEDADARAVVVERLHHRYATQVYEKCLRMLQCPGEAEDAVQETFFRAYRALRELRDRKAALGWLYRIATNVCLNMIRTRSRKGATPIGDSDAFSGPRHGSAVELHCRRLLEQLARELDQRSLEIVVAHYIDGLNQVEVAAHLGISRRSVVKRLTKVRRRVESMLGPEEDTTQAARRSFAPGGTRA
jgi:RNA polymerase sigma-70 factor (ECF subfamily)